MSEHYVRITLQENFKNGGPAYVMEKKMVTKQFEKDVIEWKVLNGWYIFKTYPIGQFIEELSKRHDAGYVIEYNGVIIEPEKPEYDINENMPCDTSGWCPQGYDSLNCNHECARYL